MELPEYVQIAIDNLEKNGFEAVVVGGAVRDYLLHKTPNDYDISTNALPDQVKKVFEKYFVLDTGIKHGTVTVFINHHPVEITTYRNEEDYLDFRHPKKIVFVSDLKTDLSRRDFTFNAICFNKEIIDLVGGIKDLHQGLIRAIGDPRLRFYEDPLRILRALRFCSDLGFAIEENTKKAMFDHKELIAKVSKERIQIEFNKLLFGNFAVKVMLEYTRVILVFIPELENIAIEEALKALSFAPLDLPVRLACLFYPLEKEIAHAVLRRLKYSNAIIKNTLYFIENIDIPLKTITDLKLALMRYSYSEVKALVYFQTLFNRNDEDAIQILDDLFLKTPCFRVKDLKIRGTDLLKIGYKEGVTIRIVLERLLEEVMNQGLLNQKDVLMTRAKALKQDYL